MATNCNNPAAHEAHNQQQLEREIRSMISTLTGHLTSLSRPGDAGAEEDGGGMRIVTLAGTNKGATMEGMDMDDAHGVVYGDDGQLSAFANSNYQAVNNSILLGGSCTAEDPGVHLVITEYVDDGGADQEKAVKKETEVKEKDKVEEKKMETGWKEESRKEEEEPLEENSLKKVGQ